LQTTFVMVKPDGVQRSLIGTIISRLEQKGLQLVGMKLMQVTPELASRHYSEHKGKPFYESLINFITSGPVVAMAWKGKDAVAVVRNLMGKTNPKEALPGTIRGDLAIDLGHNVVHGSDSPESARRELDLFFDPSEIVDYTLDINVWVYE